VAGVALLLMPAVTLLVAFLVLDLTRSALLADPTPLEVAELYAVELAAFALFGYLLYRLTAYGVRLGVGVDAERSEPGPTPDDPDGRAGSTATVDPDGPGPRSGPD
jgi:hypothetical protein